MATLAVVLLFALAGVAGADDDEEPGVVTVTADEIGVHGALLHGKVNPNDSSTTYRFEYGKTTAYGTQTAVGSAGSGESWKLVNVAVSGLEPATTYHYRVVATNEEGTSRGADKSFTTLAAGASPALPPGEATPPAEAPVPDLARSVTLEPRGGTVLVRGRGESRFAPLDEGAEVQVGSVVEASAGSVALTAALPSGATQTGRFGGGRFVVRQGRGGLVNLHLRGRVCPPETARHDASGPRASAAGKPGRRLWGRDKGGRFRTHGRHSHATVRGTRWLVEDRCEGTLTRVTHGSVVVREKRGSRRVVVNAGEHSPRAPASRLRETAMRRPSHPRRSRLLALGVVAALAFGAGLISNLTGALGGLERETLKARFDLRGAEPPEDVIVVAIDAKSFAALREQWPFPRSLHARAIRRLHAAGAREIVYDVQFTEPTVPREDLALYRAIEAAGGAVLATSESDGRGRHQRTRRRREPGGDQRPGRRLRPEQRRLGRDHTLPPHGGRPRLAGGGHGGAGRPPAPATQRLRGRGRLDRLPRPARHGAHDLLLRPARGPPRARRVSRPGGRDRRVGTHAS